MPNAHTLPLPDDLRQAVQRAPTTTVELDAYFQRIVQKRWKDPAIRVSAYHVYFSSGVHLLPLHHIPAAVLREANFFAASMRMRKDGILAGEIPREREEGGHVPEVDPLFEEFIAAEPVGVKDSARMMYYGESYDGLFTPVVTNPVPRPRVPWPIMHPTHTDEENHRASTLTDTFSEQHPERAERYGYQVSGV